MEHDLTLRREGEFKAYITGANHCGIKKNQRVKMRYVFSAVCEPKLDKRGFLFDQLTVHREFENLGSTRISCENLAMEMCERVIEAIHGENPKCQIRHISVEVSPDPFAASMTYFRDIPKPKRRKKPKKKPVRRDFDLDDDDF